MWTLWHDREIVITPGQPNHMIALRSCAGCAATTLTQPATIRAEGDALTLTAAGRKSNVSRALITDPVTLTAHGETVALHDPVAITARAGALVIVVTLPVESYVERVVASESGAADSAESLKAVAIVVRSLALHEAHGHRDYDYATRLIASFYIGALAASAGLKRTRPRWRRAARRFGFTSSVRWPTLGRTAAGTPLRRQRLASRDAGFLSAVAPSSIGSPLNSPGES